MYFRLEAIPVMVQEEEPLTIQREVLEERLTGIEPAYQAWEACALPLSYSRIPSSLTCAVPVREMFHPAGFLSPDVTHYPACTGAEPAVGRLCQVFFKRAYFRSRYSSRDC